MVITGVRYGRETVAETASVTRACVEIIPTTLPPLLKRQRPVVVNSGQ